MIDKKKLDKKIKEADSPPLAMLMEFAESFHNEIGELKEFVKQQVGVAINLNSTTVARFNELEGRFDALQFDLKQRSVERAEMEFKEKKAAYEIAKDHRDGLSTQERIEAGKIAEDRMAAAEAARKAEWRRKIDELLFSGLKAAIGAIVAVIALALFTTIILAIARQLGLVIQFPP